MLLEIPVAPYYAIVNPDGLVPRYWGTVWSLLCAQNLARSTRKQALLHIDAYYQFCDPMLGPDGLDDAIGTSNTKLVVDALQAYYIELSARPEHSSYAVKRWYVARDFIRDLCVHRSQLDANWLEVERICMSFMPLQPSKIKRHRFIRALPAVVLADVLAILSPESQRNPFKSESVRWRNWLVVHMLLLMGLRRSECLVLPVDALKQGVHPKTGEVRWWIDIVEHTDDEDPRFTQPSIKTPQSRRQLPVSPSLARLIEAYIENWRGTPNHAFLFTSSSGAPLSAESINHLLKVAKGCVGELELKELADRTGGKKTISPHDFRHTCAVIRLKQFLEQGVSHEEMLQRMRSYFGWSYESQMPLHYAKAAYEERLAEVWGDTFDEHTNILRNLPE